MKKKLVLDKNTLKTLKVNTGVKTGSFSGATLQCLSGGDNTAINCPTQSGSAGTYTQSLSGGATRGDTVYSGC